MADTNWVLIRHPHTEGTARVHRRSLDTWRVRGWVLADEPGDPEPVDEPEPAPAESRKSSRSRRGKSAPQDKADESADHTKDEG